MRKGFAAVFTGLILVGCATSGASGVAERPSLRARFEALADSYTKRGLDRWDAATSAFSRFADMVMNGRDHVRSEVGLYLDSKGENEPAKLAELVRDDARAVTQAAQAAAEVAKGAAITPDDAVLVSQVARKTHSVRGILTGAVAELSPQLQPVEAQKLLHAVAGFETEAQKISDLAQHDLPAA